MKYLKKYTDISESKIGYPQVMTSDQIEEIKFILTDFADDVDIDELDRGLLYEVPGLSDKNAAYYQITHGRGECYTIHFNIYFGKKVPQQRAGKIKNKYQNLILRLNSLGNYYAAFTKGDYYLDKLLIQYYL